MEAQNGTREQKTTSNIQWGIIRINGSRSDKIRTNSNRIYKILCNIKNRYKNSERILKESLLRIFKDSICNNSITKTQKDRIMNNYNTILKVKTKLEKFLQTSDLYTFIEKSTRFLNKLKNHIDQELYSILLDIRVSLAAKVM